MKMKYLLLTVFLFALGFSSKGQLTQTNLPIIIITTSGAIPDTQVSGTMKIIDNVSGTNQPADAPAFQGNIGIKTRGSSSNPKRSFTVETWTNVPKVSLDTALLGMPSDNDWVLLAGYTDRSLLRDLLGSYLFQSMGYYAPRMRLVEVMVNNNYEGVYLFGERIKRTAGRLDIAKLNNTDNSGIELTGGYIFKIDNSNDDFWTSNIPPPHASGNQDIKFHYEYPADNAITPVQKNYIKFYTDSFETALQSSSYQDENLGWRKFAGHNSFEDFFLFNEVVKSADAFRLATYLYKDKSKKLRVGPPWDLELSLFNTANCNAAQDTGWAHLYGTTCGSQTYLPPFWWERLVTDTAYYKEVKCKYTHYRKDILDTTSLYHFIDSVSSLLNAQNAQTRNFQKWPIWGVSLVNEPAPVSTNYNEEIGKIKSFIKRRLTYLDAQWITPGCLLGVEQISNSIATISIFPNPAHESFNAQIHLQKPSAVSIIMRDVFGRTVLQKNYQKLPSGDNLFNYSTSNLSPGVYNVTIITDNEIAGTYRLLHQ